MACSNNSHPKNHPASEPAKRTREVGRAEPGCTQEGETIPALSPNEGTGGRGTISPPDNVDLPNENEFKILLSGIDSLNISIDIEWKGGDEVLEDDEEESEVVENELFVRLKYAREKAEAYERDEPIILERGVDDDELDFMVKPFGVSGYTWLLVGGEYTLKIGNWYKPRTRPSVLVEIRSRTLWWCGQERAIERILSLLRQFGYIRSVKPSRADLCMDILMPDGIWVRNLNEFAVSKARKYSSYESNGKLNGFVFGKGAVSARLYDKAQEIRDRSGKRWFYHFWRLDEVPKGFKVLRIEYQLRRAVLRELGIDSLNDFLKFLPNIWAYCTQEWLRFQDNPGKHHTQRMDFPWWTAIQESFLEYGTRADALLREKACRAHVSRLVNQGLGYMISACALRNLNYGLSVPSQKDVYDVVDDFMAILHLEHKKESEVIQAIERKMIQYRRYRSKMRENASLRKEKGFPCPYIVHEDQD